MSARAKAAPPAEAVSEPGTAFAAKLEDALARDDFGAVSDAELEEVLTAAVRFYAAKAETTSSLPPPLAAERITPTEVVTMVSEMIRAADLNLFDVSMWYRRVR